MAGSESEKAITSATDVPFPPDGDTSNVRNDEIPISACPPPSTSSSSQSAPTQNSQQQQLSHRKYFHSRRIKKGTIEKPWLAKKDPREIWVTIIPIIGILCGLAISGILIWDGLRSVVNYSYCVVLDEDFSDGLRPVFWEREVELGGFG